MNAQRLIPHIDYTNLTENLDDQSLQALFEKALSFHPPVAAICVDKSCVARARQLLGKSSIKLATAFNFPNGDESVSNILSDIKQAQEDGADEYDIVIPLQAIRFINDMGLFKKAVIDFVRTMREALPGKTLKIIIATDVLKEPQLIAGASEAVIEAGADFIKTATGRHNEGVTLEAVNTILEVMNQANTPIGIKVSGGVKSVEFAQALYDAVQQSLKSPELNAHQFRIGASQLVEKIG